MPRKCHADRVGDQVDSSGNQSGVSTTPNVIGVCHQNEKCEHRREYGTMPTKQSKAEGRNHQSVGELRQSARHGLPGEMRDDDYQDGCYRLRERDAGDKRNQSAISLSV